MGDRFHYDAFLGYCGDDRPAVRELAERLRRDGLRVWFDEWCLEPSEDVEAGTEEGLDDSRVLVLCLSKHAVGSDWTRLEASTFRFVDPAHVERRLIPIRLDEAPIKASLARYRHLSWLPQDRPEAYARLLASCQPPREQSPLLEEAVDQRVVRLEGHHVIYSGSFSSDGARLLTGDGSAAVGEWSLTTGACLCRAKGHNEAVTSVAWADDGRSALSGSEDETLRFWDMADGRCSAVLRGHSDAVLGVAWGGARRFAVSSSADMTVRVWDVADGSCRHVLRGHTAPVGAVAWSPDQRYALSASADRSLRVWNPATGSCLRVLEGHSDTVHGLAWSRDGRRALSSGLDGTIRLWDIERGHCLRVFQGQRGIPRRLAWSPDGKLALSTSDQRTIDVWDVATGRLLRTYGGHANNIVAVVFSGDAHRIMSCDEAGVVRIQQMSSVLDRMPGGTASASSTEPTQYINAKVVLVGESGAGKTGLSRRLALGDWQPSDSTVGAWVTQWKLPVDSGPGIEKEVWLWDFGGQADQRLIHQLYLDDTALALLVFDGQREGLFELLAQWDRDLIGASHRPLVKLLVAARVDAGGLRVARKQVESFAAEHGYAGYFETSAKTGLHCDELRREIVRCIPWDEIPWRATPLLYRRLKEEILHLRDAGRALMRLNELRDTLLLTLASDGLSFGDEQLKAVVSLLAGPGVVWELRFGSWILLQPESINAYAQAVIQTIREDEGERGYVSEEQVLGGQLTYHSSMARLSEPEERVVILAMHQVLIARGVCLRQHTDRGVMLVFPSYFRRERPEQIDMPGVLVSYRFAGFIDEIYATLVVRLHHTSAFQQDQLWRYAADFRTAAGRRLGIKLTRRAAGLGELEVYCESAVGFDEKVVFSSYIHEHLLTHGRNVERLRHYVCPHCATPVGNRDIAMTRLETWLRGKPASRRPQAQRDDEGRRKPPPPSILCASCERRVPLWDEVEQSLASPSIQLRVRALQEEAALVLDAESRERILVGEVSSTIALAGQTCRELPSAVHGIDVEVEFKNDLGEPTGEKLLLVLRAGSSYVKERKSEGAQFISIADDATARHWRAQKCPVLLVHRDADGGIRWMEVGRELQAPIESGEALSRRIVFKGEVFDVMAVRRWRDLVLRGTQEALFAVARTGGDSIRRGQAVRRLASWPDEKGRDVLREMVEGEASADVRVACYEALTSGWWNEQGVREWLRAKVRLEPDDAKARALAAITSASSQLAGAWEEAVTGRRSYDNCPSSRPGYPALRAARFRLRDIGPFRDTGEVWLQPDVNVFLGDNAAGKTTVLRCLGLAALGIAAANEVEKNAAAYLRKNAHRGIIEVVFEIVPDPDVFSVEVGHCAVGLEIVAGSSRFAPLRDEEFTVRRPHEAGVGERADERSPVLLNSAEHMSALRSTLASRCGFVCGYGAVRTFNTSRSSLQTELPKRENEWVISLFDAEAPLVNPEVLSKLVRGDMSNIEDGPAAGLSSEQVTVLQTGLRKLLPDVAPVWSDQENDVHLNGTPLRFGELSEGYRSVLALVGHLLRCALRVGDWRGDPTTLDGIALVDEIDLHLHPAWQSHVVADFRGAFGRLQLVASTHAPLVVLSLKRENVFVMRRDADGQTAICHPERDPQGLGVSGILTSVFDLSATLDQQTLDKVTRRLMLHARRDDWTEAERQEYGTLADELATLGFSREFSDPYFEQFATAMARRRRVAFERLTPEQRSDLDALADQLLADVLGRDTEDVDDSHQLPGR
jgi:WD40 repeat protein